MTVKAESPLEQELAWQLRVARVPAPQREVRLVPTRRLRWDFVWPEFQIVAEVDGGEWIHGRHSRGAGMTKDAEKQNLAAAMGYRTFRFTGSMVRDGTALRVLSDAIGTAPIGGDNADRE